MTPQKVLLIGGSGFLGNAVGVHLAHLGYELNLLSRKSSQSPKTLAFPAKWFQWASDGSVPAEAMEGVDSVINLAGESIAQGRWSHKKKASIIKSRVGATEAAVRAVNRFKPRVLINASAVGFYGDTGSQVVTESSEAGTGFLAETAREWEKPLQLLNPAVRSVIMRLGVIFGTSGGALPEILKPYKLGLGASIGSGNHFLSWVHVTDVCRFVTAAIQDGKFTGTYNVTAPSSATYKKLHDALIEIFGGLKGLRAPKLFFKLALGEKSEMLLASQNVYPARALKQSFNFEFTDLRKCLDDLLA
jgi:uncharacterized protein